MLISFELAAAKVFYKTYSSSRPANQVAEDAEKLEKAYSNI